MYFNYLEKADPDITAAMKREINRQETKIEMIASENFVNYEVMEAMGSALTNKMCIRDRADAGDSSASGPCEPRTPAGSSRTRPELCGRTLPGARGLDVYKRQG